MYFRPKTLGMEVRRRKSKAEIEVTAVWERRERMGVRRRGKRTVWVNVALGVEKPPAD